MTTEEPLPYVVESTQLVMVLLTNTIGMSILIETLRTASHAFIHTHNWKNKRTVESEKCFAWVQGTGLDIFLHKYDLAYDPDKLRDSFNYLITKVS